MKPLVKFGIYLAEVQFVDQPWVYKLRPVVILAVDANETVVVKITSKLNHKIHPLMLLSKWQAYGLNFPSAVVLDPVYFLKHDQIRADRFLGILSSADSKFIMNYLDRMYWGDKSI